MNFYDLGARYFSNTLNSFWDNGLIVTFNVLQDLFKWNCCGEYFQKYRILFPVKPLSKTTNILPSSVFFQEDAEHV